MDENPLDTIERERAVRNMATMMTTFRDQLRQEGWSEDDSYSLTDTYLANLVVAASDRDE